MTNITHTKHANISIQHKTTSSRSFLKYGSVEVIFVYLHFFIFILHYSGAFIAKNSPTLPLIGCLCCLGSLALGMMIEIR